MIPNGILARLEALMRLHPLLAALACLPLVWGSPAHADDDVDVMLGLSGGATQSLAPIASAQFRTLVEEVFDVRFGLTSRDLTLVPGGPNGIYGLQGTSADLGVGLTLGPISAGFSAQAALLRNLQVVNGSLAMSQGFGLIGEPYLGLMLAGSRRMPRIELIGYYPVLRPDPAIGPRAMATLWFPLGN
jgi:hypothetical protein